MTLEEKVKKRIIEEYGSVSSFCRETRMPYSTVTSGLRKGIAGMGKKNADIILDALDLQLDSSNGCDLGDSIISENLLRIRMEKGLTQKHVCKAIGVSQGALSNYETGVRKPSTEKIRAFAKFYQVSTDEILLSQKNETNPSAAFHGIRHISINGETWFSGEDLMRVLGDLFKQK